MKIAQVAPLTESVPPKAYGGTERVVSFLTEELVAMGHQVVLFASGDSETAAELVPYAEQALRGADACADPVAYHIAMLGGVARRAREFDVVHFHLDYLHFPLCRTLGVRTVTTTHNALGYADFAPVHREFPELPRVSISDAQRKHAPQLNWRATVYHGLPADLYRFSEGGGGYLAFLGRVTPDKGVEEAVAIARGAGMELRIGAKVDPADREYFEAIEPVLKGPGVRFLGEIDHAGKQELLGGAAALLFPIDWPEPFGLVMIEAMACGTPVVAFRRGSVPEVIDEGLTGVIVDDVRAAVGAVARVKKLSRRRCREVFDRRFTADRMAREYVSLYEGLAERAPADRLH